MARIALTMLVAAIAGYFALCFPGRRVETYRDQFITAGELVSPIGLIAVHVSTPNYLTVLGKTYRDVQGTRPFYLEVPALSSILFVTGDDNQTFHVVNVKTRKHESIHTTKTSFGGHIPSDDYIESASTNEVVVATHYQDAKKSYFLNFNAGRLERIVYEKYENGKTNRSVYVDGKKIN